MFIYPVIIAAVKSIIVVIRKVVNVWFIMEFSSSSPQSYDQVRSIRSCTPNQFPTNVLEAVTYSPL